MYTQDSAWRQRCNLNSSQWLCSHRMSLNPTRLQQSSTLTVMVSRWSLAYCWSLPVASAFCSTLSTSPSAPRTNSLLHTTHTIRIRYRTIRMELLHTVSGVEFRSVACLILLCFLPASLLGRKPRTVVTIAFQMTWSASAICVDCLTLRRTNRGRKQSHDNVLTSSQIWSLSACRSTFVF